MIQNIEIEKLCPHPDNPRKDLGDLEELTESIRKNGVLQNLTVVPWFSEITGKGADDPELQKEMGYRIIIGHRRHAAAVKAGLKELPCVISDMDKKTQVATMLLENMQRSDLAVYEQAQGFQMMMDLGDTLQGIADKTGFSTKTVRRRTKLMELDQEKLKAAVGKGATLMDFAEMDKIKDIDRRNKVLECFGTSNYKYRLEKAIDEEKAADNEIKIRAVLETFATEVETHDYSVMVTVKSYYLSSDYKEIDVPADADTTEYFFYKGYAIELLKKKELSDEEAAENERDRKRTEQRNALKEVSKRTENLRMTFVKNFSSGKKYTDKIINMLITHMFEDSLYFDKEVYASAYDMDDESGKFEEKELIAKSKEEPMKAIFTAICINLNCYQNYHNWDGKYIQSKDLDKLYAFLIELGYQMSDDEKALQDGTHELFVKEEMK